MSDEAKDEDLLCLGVRVGKGMTRNYVYVDVTGVPNDGERLSIDLPLKVFKKPLATRSPGSVGRHPRYPDGWKTHPTEVLPRWKNRVDLMEWQAATRTAEVAITESARNAADKYAELDRALEPLVELYSKASFMDRPAFLAHVLASFMGRVATAEQARRLRSKK